MPGGIVAGTDAIITQLTLPEDQARQVAASASATLESGIPLPMIIWLLFFFFFFVLPIIRGVRGGRA